VPFRTVYVHALVRDEKGQKMSKSKGNIIDPLELIREYGADALRFTLAAMAAQGRDVKLAKTRVEGYRNFATKLWNAARFAEMNVCLLQPNFEPNAVRHTINKWIVGEVGKAAARVTEGIQAYRFNEAADGIYQFAWNVYCDWYLEFAKPVFTGTDELAKEETRATAAWVLGQIVHLLHPFMPFVSDELWERLTESSKVGRQDMLLKQRWPDAASLNIDPASADEMDWVIRLVSMVRAVRSEMNVPAAARMPLMIRGANQETTRRVVAHQDLILRLARLETIDLGGEATRGTLQMVLDEATLVLPLGGVIDLAAEHARLEKEIQKADAEIDKIDKRLADEKFVARAPEEVVEENRTRRADFVATKEKLAAALERVKAA
jgi:valyl-tRNA synthetase